MSPGLAAALAAHHVALEVAFENITSSLADGTPSVDATFSIDKSAAFELTGERIAHASTPIGRAVVELLGPRASGAQLLDWLKETLGSLGQHVERELRQGANTAVTLQQALSGLGDCRAVF